MIVFLFSFTWQTNTLFCLNLFPFYIMVSLFTQIIWARALRDMVKSLLKIYLLMNRVVIASFLWVGDRVLNKKMILFVSKTEICLKLFLQLCAFFSSLGYSTEPQLPLMMSYLKQKKPSVHTPHFLEKQQLVMFWFRYFTGWQVSGSKIIFLSEWLQRKATSNYERFITFFPT